jgi:hypothetical protein
MRFKDIKQHKSTKEVKAAVDEDIFGNITVTVTKGTTKMYAFNVAEHRIKHTIKKLVRRVGQ